MRAWSLFAFVMAAAVGMAACVIPGGNGPVVNEHHDVDRGTATVAKVTLDMTAGNLDVRPGATKLLEGDFSFDAPSLKPEIQYAVTGGTGTLKVSQGSHSGGSENTWRVSLDDKTPVDLEITLGAGDATILLPASVGISASPSGLIGDSNVSGLERRDGRWVNPRAADSPVTIDVQVQHAIGDLKLRAE